MPKVRLAVASAALLFLLAGGAMAQGTDSSSDKGVLNPLLDLLLGHPKRQSDVPPPPEGSSARANQKPKPKKVAAKPATTAAAVGVAAQNKPSARPLGTIATPQRIGSGVAARNLLPLTEGPGPALPPPVPPPLLPPTDDRSVAPPADAMPDANAIPVAPPADAIPLAPPADTASTAPPADAVPGGADAVPAMNPAMSAAPAPGNSVFPPPPDVGAAAANAMSQPNMPQPNMPQPNRLRPNTTASADATALPAIVDPSQTTGEPPQAMAPSADASQQAANDAGSMAQQMAQQDDSTTADSTSHRSLLIRVLGGFGGAIVAGVIAWFLLGFGPRRDYAEAAATPAPAPPSPPSPSPSPRPNRPSVKRPTR